jgi:Regulator of chromosome condensation (RCC1) repeat
MGRWAIDFSCQCRVTESTSLASPPRSAARAGNASRSHRRVDSSTGECSSRLHRVSRSTTGRERRLRRRQCDRRREHAAPRGQRRAQRDCREYRRGRRCAICLSGVPPLSGLTPVAVATGKKFTMVQPGGNWPGEMFSCGATTDGQVLCWGANSQGQLGDGTTIPRSTPIAVGVPLASVRGGPMSQPFRVRVTR